MVQGRTRTNPTQPRTSLRPFRPFVILVYLGSSIPQSQSSKASPFPSLTRYPSTPPLLPYSSLLLSYPHSAAPERISKWGHRSAPKVGGGTDLAQSAGNKLFFGRASPLCGSKSTISRIGERFRDGQYTVWSVSCLLFFYSRFPRAQPFVKVEARAPPVPHGVSATALIPIFPPSPSISLYPLLSLLYPPPSPLKSRPLKSSYKVSGARYTP